MIHRIYSSLAHVFGGDIAANIQPYYAQLSAPDIRREIAAAIGDLFAHGYKRGAKYAPSEINTKYLQKYKFAYEILHWTWGFYCSIYIWGWSSNAIEILYNYRANDLAIVHIAYDVNGQLSGIVT